MPFERNTDYIQVDERIVKFYEKYPEGRLQSELIEYHIEGRGKVGNSDVLVGWVLMKAYAYRSPDDTLPGIGYSSLTLPGGTPYTRNSEIENAETSAWGRAIAACGIEVRRGIASADEVANKESDGQAYTVTINPSAAETPAKGGHQVSTSSAQIKEIVRLGTEYSLNGAEMVTIISNMLGRPLPPLDTLTPDEVKETLKLLLASLSADEAGTVVRTMARAAEPTDTDEGLPEVNMEDQGYDD